MSYEEKIKKFQRPINEGILTLQKKNGVDVFTTEFPLKTLKAIKKQISSLI